MSGYFKDNKGAKKNKETGSKPETSNVAKVQIEDVKEDDQMDESELTPLGPSQFNKKIEEFYEDFITNVHSVELAKQRVEELRDWFENYSNNVKGGKTDVKVNLTPAKIKEICNSIHQKHVNEWKQFPAKWQLMIELFLKNNIHVVICLALYQAIDYVKTSFKEQKPKYDELVSSLQQHGGKGWWHVSIDQVEKYAGAFCVTHPSDPEDLKLVRSEINRLLKEQNYKHASVMIHSFNQHLHYDVEDIIMNLASRDYIDEVFRLIAEDESRAKTAIFSMDANKHASRARELIKKFKLDPYQFKHIIKAQAFLAIRSMFKRLGWKITEEKMIYDPKDYVLVFVEILVKDKMYSEALSVVQRQNINLPRYLSDVLQGAKGLKPVQNELFTDDFFGPSEVFVEKQKVEEYLTLGFFGIKEKDVHFLDEIDKEFEDVTEELLKSKVIGVDAEFDGDLLGYQESQVSILQIASENIVAIFDFRKLKGDERLYQFCVALFGNSEIEKVGHTFTSDIKCLRETFKNKPLDFASVINIDAVFQEGTTKLGLAAIVKKVYDLKFSKHDQQSNWKKRPLRRSQIHYAALDAVATLHILLKVRKEGNEDLVSYIHKENYGTGDQNAEAGKSDKKGILVQNENLIETYKTSGSYKFIVDGMLKKLAANLRNVGLDAIFAEESMKPKEIIQVAEAEDRIILTRDMKLINCKKDRLLIKIVSTNPFTQLEQILDLLDIKITKGSLLSRCVKCNEKNLKRINLEEAQVVLQWENHEESNIKEFWQCQKCKQVYWEGGTFDRAKRMFEELVGKQEKKNSKLEIPEPDISENCEKQILESPDQNKIEDQRPSSKEAMMEEEI